MLFPCVGDERPLFLCWTLDFLFLGFSFYLNFSDVLLLKYINAFVYIIFKDKNIQMSGFMSVEEYKCIYVHNIERNKNRC